MLQHKDSGDTEVSLWLRWPFASPARDEKTALKEEWFETLRACFPHYAPPAEPNWDEVLELLTAHLSFNPEVWPSLEVEKVVLQLKRCRPPLTGSELAPKLHTHLLERRLTGYPFTWEELRREADQRCEPYLSRLPGAQQKALEILHAQGLLEAVGGGEQNSPIRYVAVENPVPAADKRAAHESSTGIRRKKGRPPKPSEDPRKDSKLFGDWKGAKASGTRTIDEFAQARRLEARDVRSALDRHRKRGRSGKK